MHLALNRAQQGGLLLGMLAGLGGFLWLKRRPQGSQEAAHPAAAFADEGAAQGAPAHVRDAGSESTRDDRERWDRIDQASDESFPASDPPATY